MTDVVAETLRRMILIGDLAPGQRVTQDELSRMLDVSTTPIREALVKLEAHGLVRTSPNRSFRVVNATQDDVRDTYWQLAALSSELARRACANRSDELAAALGTAQRDYQRGVTENDVLLMESANWRFHRAINLAANSPRLLFLLKATLRFVPDDMYTQIEGWGQRSVSAHAMIVSAIEAGYLDSAAQAAAEHVREAGDLLISLLESRGFWSQPG